MVMCMICIIMGYIIMCMIFKIVVLLTVFWSTWAQSTLTKGRLRVVKSPQDPSLQSAIIDIAPASFSTPPTNMHDYIVQVVVAIPFDACTSLDEVFYDSAYPLFMLVDGGAGKCGYKRRAQMSKEVGAKGIIIIDDNHESAYDPYSNFQDDTFLVLLAKGQVSNLGYVDSFIGSITIDEDLLAKKTVEVWLSALNAQSYTTVRMWNQTLKEIPEIGKRVTWEPRYAFYGCFASSMHYYIDCDSDYIASCACGGQFCSPQIHKQASDVIVKEDVRQKQIFLQYRPQYLNYMSKFKELCFKNYKEKLYIEDCSTMVMNQLSIDANKVNQVADLFVRTCNGELYAQLNADRNRFGQLGYYPAVIVEHQPIDYKSKSDFQVQMCKKLGMEKVTGCMEVIKKETIINTSVSILFFLAIVGALVGIGALVIACYRRTLKNQMHKEVKMQVSASVENYFALAEGK